MSVLRQYCLTLNLNDDDALISEYEEYHKPGNVWPEVIDSIFGAGILDMQIYRTGLQLIMVMTVADSFSFDDKAVQDRRNPRVAEWEGLMERFQITGKGAASKWQEVSNIFELSKHRAIDGPTKS